MFWLVLAGVGNGNIGVVRTMAAEIVQEKKHQGRACLLFPLVLNLGVVIGLALDGCLPDSIINLPWLFRPKGLLNLARDPEGVAWIREYSYAVPTIFNASFLTCSLLLTVLGLKETMLSKVGRKDYRLEVRRRSRGFFKSVVS